MEDALLSFLTRWDGEETMENLNFTPINWKGMKIRNSERRPHYDHHHTADKFFEYMSKMDLGIDILPSLSLEHMKKNEINYLLSDIKIPYKYMDKEKVLRNFYNSY